MVVHTVLVAVEKCHKGLFRVSVAKVDLEAEEMLRISSLVC